MQLRDQTSRFLFGGNMIKQLDILTCKLVRERALIYNTVHSAGDALETLRALGLHDASDEFVYMLCLSAKGDILGIHQIAHGDLTSCAAHPREIFKRALLNNACAIIISHNHPSGDSTPSADDNNFTERIKQAGQLLGIQLVDHIIVGYDEHYSYCSQGAL